MKWDMQATWEASTFEAKDCKELSFAAYSILKVRPDRYWFYFEEIREALIILIYRTVQSQVYPEN